MNDEEENSRIGVVGAYKVGPGIIAQALIAGHSTFISANESEERYTSYLERLSEMIKEHAETELSLTPRYKAKPNKCKKRHEYVDGVCRNCGRKLE